VHAVQKASFDMVLPVSGELAAMQQVEIRNKLETRAVITEIVPEGTLIKKGDVVIRLAQEEILDRIKDATDKVNTTNSSAIAAQQSLAIKQGEKQSELDKADVAVRIAELALDGWKQGEVVNKRQQLALAKETAAINLARLKDRFVESDKLVKQGFIAKDEFERDRIAMIEAEAKVKQAALDLEVYEKYTFFQDEAKKKSDLEQAHATRRRVEEKFNAELVKAEADVASANFQLQSMKERLANLETQFSNTTLVAPIDGLIVYATSIDSSNGGRGGGDAQPPQVGTELRPNELVILLPDTTRMVANLKVSEALSGRIRPGQRVTVFSDAMPNQPIAGEVTGVSVLAAAGGWRDPNRREYTVKAALETDPALGLKPAMRCKAEILLGRVEDAVNVPVQAIFRQGPVAFIYVEAGSGFEQRQVEIGRASELQVEIRSGVAPGDMVLLREPKAFEITKKLDAAVFELANASAPGFGGARPPAMNVTPPADGTPGGAGSGAGSGGGSGEGRPRGGRPDGAGRGRPTGDAARAPDATSAS
jgi:multidrug resistance efflux pump